MPDFDLLEEGRVAGQKGRQRISVHEHNIRFRFTQNLLEPLQYAQRNFVQTLVRLHHVKIIIRNDAKHVKHLIKHLPVLCRDANHRFDILGVFLQLQDKRSHLDRLRPYAEDRHHFDFRHSGSLP
ncbi:hypothetical protein D1872_227770 [compost metagenome]